jgi:hypothetical protein
MASKLMASKLMHHRDRRAGLFPLDQGGDGEASGDFGERR